MSGGGSTNTPDMLRLSPSRGPVPPMDWIGRANAGSGLDLRPTGPRKLTRLAWPRDAAVATGAIARPPPRLHYVEESFRVLGRPISGCLGNGVHRVGLGSPRGSVAPPVGSGRGSESVAGGGRGAAGPTTSPYTPNCRFAAKAQQRVPRIDSIEL